MQRYFTVLFLALLLTGACADAQTEEKVQGDPVQAAGIAWVGMSEALRQSDSTGKKILIDFYTDWCGWCKRMDKAIYADSNVIAYLNEHFLSVKLNPEKEGKIEYMGGEYTNRQFASAFEVRGYPATGFMNEKNEVITLLPGAVLDPNEFLTVLRYIAEDHYLTLSFEDFKTTN